MYIYIWRDAEPLVQRVVDGTAALASDGIRWYCSTGILHLTVLQPKHFVLEGIATKHFMVLEGLATI